VVGACGRMVQTRVLNIFQSKSGGKAVPWLRRLVDGSPPRRPGFHTRWSCDIYDGQSGMGQVSFAYFGFPCQFSSHRMLIYRPGLIQWVQLVAEVPSGLSLSPHHGTLKKNLSHEVEAGRPYSKENDLSWVKVKILRQSQRDLTEKNGHML
jgi:hypothetical protein